MKNINISNGVIPKKLNKQSSAEGEVLNGHSVYDRKGAHSSPSHNSSSYEGSPNKNKVCVATTKYLFYLVYYRNLLANCLQLSMASAGQGSPLRSQLALKLKPNTPKKSAPTPSPTVQVCFF